MILRANFHNSTKNLCFVENIIYNDNTWVSNCGKQLWKFSWFWLCAFVCSYIHERTRRRHLGTNKLQRNIKESTDSEEFHKTVEETTGREEGNNE